MRAGILKQTLNQLARKTTLAPIVFNVPDTKTQCHKGANERALFDWAKENVAKDEWLLRLEDDLIVGDKVEETIARLQNINGVGIFSLGDLYLKFEEEVFYEDLRFRKIQTPTGGGIQALLIKGECIPNIAALPSLDKPSDLKILSSLDSSTHSVWQLINPQLFKHRPIPSICWPGRGLLNSVGNQDTLESLKFITVNSKRLYIDSFQYSPEQRLLAVGLNNGELIVVRGDSVPENLTVDKLNYLIKSNLTSN